MNQATALEKETNEIEDLKKLGLLLKAKSRLKTIQFFHPTHAEIISGIIENGDFYNFQHSDLIKSFKGVLDGDQLLFSKEAFSEYDLPSKSPVFIFEGAVDAAESLNKFAVLIHEVVKHFLRIYILDYNNKFSFLNGPTWVPSPYGFDVCTCGGWGDNQELLESGNPDADLIDKENLNNISNILPYYITVEDPDFYEHIKPTLMFSLSLTDIAIRLNFACGRTKGTILH